jgi:hypothetical protein
MIRRQVGAGPSIASALLLIVVLGACGATGTTPSGDTSTAAPSATPPVSATAVAARPADEATEVGMTPTTAERVTVETETPTPPATEGPAVMEGTATTASLGVLADAPTPQGPTAGPTELVVDPTSESDALPPDGANASASTLLTVWAKQGVTVEPGDSVEQPFFSVIGQTVAINGQDVQIFEYPTEAEAEAEAATIDAAGNPATMMIRWIAPPHFYRTGRVIALYLGDDVQVLRALEAALGPQFAGR